MKHEIPDNSNRSPSPFSPFAFAVIADPHLETPDQRGVEKMRQVIDKINQQADIAFVLVLGDLIWHQPLSELKALLANLQVPSHLVLGNHDAPMIADYGHEFGSVYYTFEYAGCLFVGLWNAVPAAQITLSVSERLLRPPRSGPNMENRQATGCLLTRRPKALAADRTRPLAVRDIIFEYGGEGRSQN